MRTKEQQKEYNRLYRLQNPERIRELKRQFSRNNPDRIREYRKRYLAKHPVDLDYRKNAYLKNLYGITLDDYNLLLEKQNGKCAICKLEERILDPRIQQTKRLAVDHNHDTGQVRGLLCGNCNKNLGVLENQDFVSRAANYLKQYKTKEN